MKIPDSACMLRPIRFLGNGDLRLYEPVEFLSAEPAKTCAMYYRRCSVFGGVARDGVEQAGMCDVLDSNDDIVADFPLTRKGLNWLYRALNTRVEV